MKHAIASLVLALVLVACGGPSGEGAHGHDEVGADEHAGHGADEFERGDHGGRLLEKGGYAVELGIAEEGTPPKFQAWLYEGDSPLPADAGQVEVRLTRLGNVDDRHVLRPKGDRLLADSVVGEPHSFDVEVLATIERKPLRWEYASYEGRTTIADDVATEAGIRVSPAAPGVIADEHEVHGLVAPIEGRVAHVVARFPGPIRRLGVDVGDVVRAGQELASIESNLSLSTYAVTSPIAGTVLARNASVGGVANEGTALFEIADLSKLRVDLHIFGADVQHIRAGVPVQVTRMSDGARVETTLEQVLPGTAAASQSAVARATIENTDGQWRPGAAVKANITVEHRQAPLVVPLSALQTFRDWDVVFVREGDTYEVRPVKLGNRDAARVEILEGIAPGAAVVVEQSYLVKADIEKSGATHDH